MLVYWKVFVFFVTMMEVNGQMSNEEANGFLVYTKEILGYPNILIQDIHRYTRFEKDQMSHYKGSC